jgi:hypothetical protein
LVNGNVNYHVLQSLCSKFIIEEPLSQIFIAESFEMQLRPNPHPGLTLDELNGDFNPNERGNNQKYAALTREPLIPMDIRRSLSLYGKDAGGSELSSMQGWLGSAMGGEAPGNGRLPPTARGDGRVFVVS